MALELDLLSPVGSRSFTFKCPVASTKDGDEVANTLELVETIRLVCDELPELAPSLESNFFTTSKTKNPDDVKKLAEKYNKQLANILKKKRCNGIESDLKTQASRDLLRHIIQVVYNQTITNPDKLNQYVPFSPGVYGESSFELITQVAEHSNITESDVFIDLGSGVGQVVLQMAGSTPCPKFSWGIELADWPSQYAEQIDRRFRHLMKWWGKAHGNYKLVKGDFLDKRHSKKIKSASVIFVNNFAFGPQLDHQLCELFKDAVEGTRIISSKAFCPLNFRITQRSLNNIGCMMRVTQLPKIKGAVSWTGNAVTYFLHVIDRTQLYEFFESHKDKTKKSRNRKEEKVVDNKTSPSQLLNEIEKSLSHYLDGIRKQLMDEVVQFGSASYKKDIQDAIQYQEALREQRENEAKLLENEVARLKNDCVSMVRDCFQSASSDLKKSVLEMVKGDDELCSEAAQLEEEQMKALEASESRKRNRAQFEVQRSADDVENVLKDVISDVMIQISSLSTSFDTPLLDKQRPASDEVYEPAMAGKLKLRSHFRLEKVAKPWKPFCPVNDVHGR